MMSQTAQWKVCFPYIDLIQISFFTGVVLITVAMETINIVVNMEAGMSLLCWQPVPSADMVEKQKI